MAIRTILVDDLNGSEEGVNTVQFALDGSLYEIDLDITNDEGLRKVLAPYVEKARQIGGTKKKSSKKNSRDDIAEIREWAKRQGMEIAERGRVPREIREAFDAARRAA